MRGILVQSLTSRGVPFDVALATATAVRDEVIEQSQVSLVDLGRLVERHLPQRFDLDVAPLRLLDAPLVSDGSGSSSPFSKGILAVSLQGAGMDPSDAYDVARNLEAQMVRDEIREIDRVALRDQLAAMIESTHGSKAAGRYRTRRLALEQGRPIFLLLGGSTGVGKTSIAVEAARRLEISHVIGTDSIRQIMRLMFSRDLMPEIHSSTYDAYEFLPLQSLGSSDAVIEAFLDQAHKIAVGVHALLDRAVAENSSMAIEGVNLVPGILDLNRYKDHAHVISLVVAGLDEKTYRGRFRSRAASARERSMERYLSHFDEILAIQNHLLAAAEEQGTPIIDNVHLDDAVQSVVRSVLAELAKAIPARSEQNESS